MALAPELKIIAPWTRLGFPRLRGADRDYCKEHDIPVEASLKKPYSMDRNLLHISYEAGILEDPWFDRRRRKKCMFKLSVPAEDAPEPPEYVELDFEKGGCVAVKRGRSDCKRLSPAACCGR